jgi:hypothetical protein
MSCPATKRLCDKLVISDSVTFTGGNLVIDLPSASYNNGQKYCIVVAQTIPATTTIDAPVVITIGGDATTTYPLVNCDCSQVTACAIRTRTKYGLRISTDATSAVFKSLKKLNCYPTDTLAVIPTTATTVAGASTFAVTEEIAPLAVAKTTTKTAKGAQA